MTDKEILEKAISRAVDGGWKSPFSEEYGQKWEYLPESKSWWDGLDDYIHLYEIIYSHDFPKALWGEDIKVRPMEDFASNRPEYYLPSWLFHLREMVTAEDPIKYLGENMPAGND